MFLKISLKITGRYLYFVNEQVEPYCVIRDAKVKNLVENSGGQFKSYSDTTIFSLGEIKNGEGNQYKVFTPFKNQALKTLTPNHYSKILYDLSLLNKGKEVKLKNKDEYNLQKIYSSLKRSDLLKGGRNEALSSLKKFYESGLVHYRSNRDIPSGRGTSLLSAHLHFGTIRIREAFRTAYENFIK